jgi:hypothetical protein
MRMDEFQYVRGRGQCLEAIHQRTWLLDCPAPSGIKGRVMFVRQGLRSFRPGVPVAQVARRRRTTRVSAPPVASSHRAARPAATSLSPWLG